MKSNKENHMAGGAGQRKPQNAKRWMNVAFIHLFHLLRMGDLPGVAGAADTGKMEPYTRKIHRIVTISLSNPAKRLDGREKNLYHIFL